jgi:hypothetical protein
VTVNVLGRRECRYFVGFVIAPIISARWIVSVMLG